MSDRLYLALAFVALSTACLAIGVALRMLLG